MTPKSKISFRILLRDSLFVYKYSMAYYQGGGGGYFAPVC